MSEERDDGAAGFKVKDRRRFDEEGQPREAAAGDEPARETDETDPSAPARPGGQTLPEIDFSTFIISLTTSALVHLGEAPHPEGETRRELDLAKQTIDIIGLLKEKTRGNLTAEEAKLIEELLYDLRLRYVAACR